MFWSKKKFIVIKSKTLMTLKISLANVKISIHKECFKTFSGNIAWLELYALSSCNVKKKTNFNQYSNILEDQSSIYLQKSYMIHWFQVK